MSHFIFKAKKVSGEIYSGERDAMDRYELYKLIRENGQEVLSVREQDLHSSLSTFAAFRGIFSKVREIDKINLARNLGSMLQAGLPLSRALSVMERQTSVKPLKIILGDIMMEIDRGQTLTAAISRHPKVFSPLFISMVHAGEQGGTLAEALRTVALQMDRVYALEKRVKGALMYPAVILVAMAIVGVLMFIFVIPTLTKTFTELGVALPASTRFVLGLSSIMRDNGLIAISILALLVCTFVWVAKTSIGKKYIHSFLIRMPLFGGLVQEVNSARTARTLASLLASGVAVVESMSITAEVVQNVSFRRIIIEAREAIRKGAVMSKVFGMYPKVYPPFFAEMLSVGEETGKTDEILANVAHYYEEDVEQKTKDMSTVIEPLLILLIGGAVGFFAISMISPMYSLVNVI
jgi:type IV pilus assembly protein PilC